MYNYIKDFITYSTKSVTPYHAVINSVKILENNGYVSLDYTDEWKLSAGQKYYTILYNTVIVAFIIPKNIGKKISFTLIGSHTDSPSLKLKPQSSIVVDDKYIKLNTEVYGGPLLYTWFDRPLSIAGLITYRENGELKKSTIDFKDVKAILPSIAIHLNKEVNQKGLPITYQKDILPLFYCSSDQEKSVDVTQLISELSELVGVQKNDIIDYDLFLYDVTPPSLTGSGDLLQASRLDNLSMLYDSIRALVDSEAHDNKLLILMGFDNEEIGSRSVKGASSGITSVIIERIFSSLGLDRGIFLRSLSESLIVSADVSHALHPNAVEKSDPSSKNYLNHGPVIKYSHNQKYMTDIEIISKVLDICKNKEIPIQKFVNHSDISGGSTIGPHISSMMSTACIDIGIPLLAMHSIKELGGVKDIYNAYKLMQGVLGLE